MLDYKKSKTGQLHTGTFNTCITAIASAFYSIPIPQ